MKNLVPSRLKHEINIKLKNAARNLIFLDANAEKNVAVLSSSAAICRCLIFLTCLDLDLLIPYLRVY